MRWVLLPNSLFSHHTELILHVYFYFLHRWLAATNYKEDQLGLWCSLQVQRLESLERNFEDIAVIIPNIAQPVKDLCDFETVEWELREED